MAKTKKKDYVVVERVYLESLQSDAYALADITSALEVNGVMVPSSKEKQKQKLIAAGSAIFTYEGKFDEEGFPTFDE